MVEHHAEKKFGMLFRLLVHLFDLLRINACGLVAKHVEPGFHRVRCDLRMEIVRSFNHNDVDKSRFEHILIVVENLDSFEVLLCVLASFRGYIAHRGELCALDERGEFRKYLCIERALFAYADNAVSDLFFVHYFTSASSFLRF